MRYTLAELRWKFIVLSTHTKKLEIAQIKELASHLEELEKKNKKNKKPRSSRRQEIRAELNKVGMRKKHTKHQ